MTAVADFEQSWLRRTLRRAGTGLYALATTRQRPVLADYFPQRSPRWRLASKTLLLGVMGFVAMFYGLLSAVMPLQIILLMSMPLAILALLVIWALPEAATIPEKSLSYVFFAFFVLTIVWPNYLSIALPGLPWISVRRLLGAIATILFLISLSTSAKFRSQIWSIASAEKLFVRLLIGFGIVQFISALINQPALRLGRVLDAQMTGTVILLVSAWYFSAGNNRIGKWLVTLSAITVGLIVLSFFERHAQQVLWVNHIPSFLHVDEAYIEQSLKPRFRGSYRAVTTFSNPLIYGEFLAFVVPFVLHYLMNSRKLMQMVFWGGMDLLLLIGAFVSSARLSLVGFIVAHGFYMFLWAVRRWQTHKPGLIGPALTLMYPALIVTAGVLLVTVDAFRIRILGGGATQASNLARAEQFNMALPAIIRKPLFGYGPGGSGQAIGWKSLDGQLSVDNYYLTISADYGVTGLVLFFGMIAMMTWWLSREGIRAPGTRSPLAFAVAAFLAVFLTTRTVLSTPDNNPLVYLVLGLGVALLYDARHDRRITI